MRSLFFICHLDVLIESKEGIKRMGCLCFFCYGEQRLYIKPDAVLGGETIDCL